MMLLPRAKPIERNRRMFLKEVKVAI